MKHTPFRFKQFAVHHDRSTMKVGTDAVLLGAWANITNVNRALDIGTGSGVIALMIAQRTAEDVVIDAVELEAHAFEEAIDNVNQSPWSQRIHVHHEAIQQFEPEARYELIITNPPYFENSQKPPDEKRTVTRHTETLSHQDIFVTAQRLLTADGRLAIVLPHQEGLNFIQESQQYGFTCVRQWSFRSRASKPIERWLLEFSRHPSATETGEIVLYEDAENWSSHYRELTRDFYIKL